MTGRDNAQTWRWPAVVVPTLTVIGTFCALGFAGFGGGGTILVMAVVGVLAWIFLFEVIRQHGRDPREVALAPLAVLRWRATFSIATLLLIGVWWTGKALALALAKHQVEALLERCVAHHRQHGEWPSDDSLQVLVAEYVCGRRKVEATIAGKVVCVAIHNDAGLSPKLRITSVDRTWRPASD